MRWTRNWAFVVIPKQRLRSRFSQVQASCPPLAGQRRRRGGCCSGRSLSPVRSLHRQAGGLVSRWAPPSRAGEGSFAPSCILLFFSWTERTELYYCTSINIMYTFRRFTMSSSSIIFLIKKVFTAGRIARKTTLETWKTLWADLIRKNELESIELQRKAARLKFCEWVMIINHRTCTPAKKLPKYLTEEIVEKRNKGWQVIYYLIT